jgi:gamma-glutamyltranspeptidase/glutathione hydrolase
LLDEAYLKSRAALIQPNGPLMKTAQPGQPEGAKLSYAPMPDQAEYGTSHIGVVDAQGLPIANRVEPGKRPRSSMSPTLVFDKATGQRVMSTGSPGGALIIHDTAKTLVGTLERGLTPQQAIDLPNFGSLNGPSLLEQRRFPATVVDALKARGADVREMEMTSGLQAIQRVDGKLLGGADPRREGVVLGD